MSTDIFYQNLKSFSDFQGITDDNNYQKLPSDWVIVVTDIKASTKAIQEGRYKDVNTIGAASVVAVQNAIQRQDFPYFFGGDGAILLIPPAKINDALVELTKLKKLSSKKFDLQLRVGKVDVEEIYKYGATIEVAKFELAHGKCVAMFRGDGLRKAEKVIKTGQEKYQLPDSNSSMVDLNGLSCRWNAIPSARGKILSLIVASRALDHSPTYGNVLKRIDEIFEGELRNANPVNIASMTYKSIRQCFSDEKRYHSSLFSSAFVSRFLEIIIAVLVFRFNVPPLFFNPGEYINSMSVHSDYRKFDGMLRMVIDCSDDQYEAIRKFLDAQYREGKLFYGLFASKVSLMTCYVHDINNGNHIHFIDGGNGGYAMAAEQLKSQMKWRSNGCI